MSISVRGVVKNGVVVPSAPLREGAQVEIHLPEPVPEIPLDVQEELAAWQRASVNALELVERLGQESKGDEKR